MTIGVIQRVAFNLGVIPRVVDQHIFPRRRLGKTIMARAILAVFIAGPEHRLRGFMPVCRLQRIGLPVNPEQPHAVVFVGGAGGIADEQLIAMHQMCIRDRYKSGHALNNKLLQAVLAKQEAWEYVTFEDDAKLPMAFRAPSMVLA